MKKDFDVSRKLRKWFQLHPQWDAETKQDKLDRFIIRIFPGYVVAMFVLTLVLFCLEWGHHGLLGHFLYSLCCAYAFGFVLLGIPVFCLSERTVYRNWYLVPIMYLAAAVIGVVLWVVFGAEHDGINNFISGFYFLISWGGFTISPISVIVGMWTLLTVSIFASYGVIAVIVAYFRKDYHRILLGLEKNDCSRICKRARALFQIPSIIDVTEVTLAPEADEDRFPKKLFFRLFIHEIVIGLIVASYLFLNPVFLKTIPYAEMMVIVLLLSVFISTLVIPVSIVRSLGAEAHSAGNRPYPLWEGMKKKLFHPTFYVALFFTLLWISVYTDMDSLRIITHYLGYIAYMLCLSAIVSFIYINTFYVPFRNGIVRNFYKRKGKE